MGGLQVVLDKVLDYRLSSLSSEKQLLTIHRNCKGRAEVQTLEASEAEWRV